MIFKSMLFLLACMVGGQVYAESYMYLTNNTLEKLTLNTAQTGYGNITHGDQWQQLAFEVEPLETVKFLRFNRDKGIKWGKEYQFTTTVNTQQQQVQLTQKLVGTMTFSKMWLSAEQDPWFYDRDIHRIAVTEKRELAYRSEYARASGDDIRYVISDAFEPAAPAQYSNQLRVLNYNAWILLPGITAKNSANRLETIAQYMTGYDAIVFEEVFDPLLNAQFRAAISSEYPYQTETPWKLGKLLTGGSFIASRWPIVQQDSQVYDACIRDGCLAAKGINYAHIQKGSNDYHIFGTHTHAYTTPDDIAVRFAHLAQFKQFVDSKQIDANEPVIMAGDFNVDKINFPSEYEDFIALLNGTEPQAEGLYPYSYAGKANVYAEDQYNEYLDYVLFSNEHVAPFNASNTLLVPRSTAPEHWGSWDLSDHFPVEGYFEFPLSSELVD